MAQTALYAEEHVDRYKIDPLVAAEKLATIWCDNPTEMIDVWGCDFPCKEFYEAFLDHCKEWGYLKEALKIWWCVHNCPGTETDPCFSEATHQYIIDYSKRHGLESETEWLKPHGMDKFKLLEELTDLHGGNDSWFCWKPIWKKLNTDTYPNPKDENGRYIPMITGEDGKPTPWPKHPDGSFMKMDEF